MLNVVGLHYTIAILIITMIITTTIVITLINGTIITMTKTFIITMPIKKSYKDNGNDIFYNDN